MNNRIAIYDATLRELLCLKPAPEFFEWTKKMGILDDNGRMTARASISGPACIS